MTHSVEIHQYQQQEDKKDLVSFPWGHRRVGRLADRRGLHPGPSQPKVDPKCWCFLHNTGGAGRSGDRSRCGPQHCFSSCFSGWGGQGLGCPGPLGRPGLGEAAQSWWVHSGLVCMKQGSRGGCTLCFWGPTFQAEPLPTTHGSLCSFSCSLTMGC